MSSIQFLSKVTREMTNNLFVWLPLNMSAFDEMVDIFQEGIAMVTECVFSFERFGKVWAGSLYLAPAFAESHSCRLNSLVLCYLLPQRGSVGADIVWRGLRGTPSAIRVAG